LTLHHMNWRIDALHLYEKARDQFREAALDWQRSSPGHIRVIQCEQAADELHDCTTQVLEGLTVKKPSSPTSSAWTLKSAAQTSQLKPSVITPLTSVSPLIIVALATVILLIILMGLTAYAMAGPIALIAYGAVVVTMAVVAIIVARLFTQYGFFLSVPIGYGAVVERDDELFMGQPRQRYLLVPWIYHIRALVPLGELIYKLPKLKVSLGKNQKGNTNAHVFLAIQVRYKVCDFDRATSPSGGLSAGKRKRAGVLKEEELRTNWESRLQVDLAPVLTRHMWGATDTDCCASRDKLQTNLRNDLTQETRLWGVEVEDLTILDIGAA